MTITVVGLILAGVRDRVLGSRWIAWLGVIGAVAFGAAPFLVVVLQIGWAPILFPIGMLIGVWLILAAVWPSKIAHVKRLSEEAWV